MNLKDCRQAYYDYSAKASAVARNLGFAGIAIVWIFRIGEGPHCKIPPELLPATLLFAITLGLDLLHYVSGTVMWGAYHRAKERSGLSEEVDFSAPAWLNWPMIGAFVLKVMAVGTAYVFLIRYVWIAWVS